MAVPPTNHLPELITDGGIETHIIFNMGVELPHFSAFPLNDSATGRDLIRRYIATTCQSPVPRGGASYLLPTAGAQVLIGLIGLAMIGRS